MLGRSFVAQNISRMAVRNMGSHAKPTTFKPKTFKEAWLSDSGAYPVMGVIVFAGVFCISWGLKVMLFHPDARISKSDRKSIFRGELKGTA